MSYTIKKLESIEEMLPALHLIKELTPNISEEEYAALLKQMIPHNYYQIAAYDSSKLIAVSGYWIGAKIYCGKYLEIDNLVVSAEYRSKSIGKLLVDWMQEEAKKRGCKNVLLDAYVENFKAHRFYYREGFIARGFHYLKKL